MNYTVLSVNLNSKMLFWIIGFLFFVDFLTLIFLSGNWIIIIEQLITVISFILFICCILKLFIKVRSQDSIESDIYTLKKQKKEAYHEKVIEKIENEIIYQYKTLNKIKNKRLFIYSIKTKNEFIETSYFENYIPIIFILSILKNSLDFFKPYGPIIFLSTVIISILFCISVIKWEKQNKVNEKSSSIVMLIITIILCFLWGKNSYIRNYGNEELGSFFEKNEYYSKYFVVLEETDNDFESYNLPADIHVSTKTEDSDSYYDYYGLEQTQTQDTKYIKILKVYFPNGDTLIFSKCEFEFGDEVTCIDQKGKEWNVKITREKVK